MSKVASSIKLLPHLLCKGSSTSASHRTIITSASQNAWFFSKDKQSGAGYSKTLGKDSSVYEIVTDTVVPSKWDEYIAYSSKLVECEQSNPQFKNELVASWCVVTGDRLFKAIHLSKYSDGWTDIDETRIAMKQDLEYQQLYKSGLATIGAKHKEFEKTFSFWPSPDKRSGSNVYDIRTYELLPGSMYDWSNYWAKGIKCRAAVRPDIPYAGFFPQLGQLHFIYHIWCYPSMADRKACRESTWNNPEWESIVANTVPLVKTMSTRILEPLPFSPTQ